jgi:bifunctional enzyme CysN/CysC
MPEAKDLLRLITAGSVDDGKSTLIGRLLYESQGVYEDQLHAVRNATPAGRGLELAFITDGLRAEREQGITIDVAYRYFATPRRKFIIADAPGHEQYTRNMVTGASTADLALILLDARKGVLPQTRRHAYIASLLGIRHLLVVVNKMDLVDFQREVFDAICTEFRAFTASWEIADLRFIPASALRGDSIVKLGEAMPWYDGPTVLEHLETVPVSRDHNFDDLRIPVQYVIRQPDFRGYAGQVASGVVRVGDPVLVLPSGRLTRVARLTSYDGDQAEAFAPMAVTVCLADAVDVSRGDMLVDPQRVPSVGQRLAATLVWMSETPLRIGQPYLIKLATQQVCGTVTYLRHALDIRTLGPVRRPTLTLNEIGEVEIDTHRVVAFDAYRRNRATGAFIVMDLLSNATVAAGVISGSAPGAGVPAEIQPRRALAVWFTGLSCSGKTTISRAVRERLAAQGHQVELLDGDIVRKHLSKGLGFSREDREENIRRIGFVARLLADHGVIVLVAAISPYRDTRDEVRRSIGDFVEVYVNAPLEICEQRDDKGLYQQARAGKIRGFTGIDDPYEPPLAPELECRTDRESVEECVEKVLGVLTERLRGNTPG